MNDILSNKLIEKELHILSIIESIGKKKINISFK